MPFISKKRQRCLTKTPKKHKKSYIALKSDSCLLLGNTSAPTGEQLKFETSAIALLSTALSSMYPQFIDVAISANKIACKLLMEESGLFFLSLTKNAREMSGFVVLYQENINVVFLVLRIRNRHTCTKRKVELNDSGVKKVLFSLL